MLEWDCFLKTTEDGASEGARCIADHIIRALNDFVTSGADRAANRAMPGVE